LLDRENKNFTRNVCKIIVEKKKALYSAGCFTRIYKMHKKEPSIYFIFKS
jgi:hypothetical protein